MLRRPLGLWLITAILATAACATTVNLAALPERTVTELREPACNDADRKIIGKGECQERRKTLITRCTASTVRITVARYNPKDLDEENYVGTGVILEESGLVLTAYHVIKDADFILVTERRIKEHGDSLYFADVRRYPARVVYSAPKRDVALLMPMYPQKTERMVPMPLRHGREPMVGEHVWQFGQASGIRDGTTDKWPMTSAGTRPVMQAKIPIRRGDSGGPVVDSEGRLIGIVLSKHETEDILYYMPIDHALDALRPWLDKTRVYEVVPKK